MTAAEKAVELCAGPADDRAKVDAVTGFIVHAMIYDHLKARTVRRGYKPDADTTPAAMRGICWDFAVLVAAMLRSVGVRCRVVIGWTDGEYHAWNEVWIGGAWEQYDLTAAITGQQYIVYKAERFQ